MLQKVIFVELVSKIMLRSQNKNINIKPIFSATLVVIYLLVFIVSPHLAHHHDHLAHVCNEDTEVDPCHRHIFHNDLEKGCKHEQHLFSAKEDCESCAKILNTYPKLIFESNEVTYVSARKILYLNKSASIDFAYFKNQLSRAPPKNVLISKI